MSRATRAEIEISYMVRGDLRAVLAIDRASFARPWDGRRFLEVLQSQSVNGRVASVDGRIAGFFVYTLSHQQIHVARFAVSPEWRGLGIGSAMAASVTGRLARSPRMTVNLNVRETNRGAIEFWRSRGFRATGVLRDHYGDEDAYAFEYRAPESDAECAGR